MYGPSPMKPLRGTELKRFLRGTERPSRRLVLMLHDVEDPVNVGAAFRTADAAGVEALILSGITPSPPHKLIDRVGRMKHERVKWERAEPEAALSRLTSEDFEIVAVELCAESAAYHEREYGPKVCLVVGHEDHGVPRKVLERCHSAVFIPMHGKGASLNVSVALAVATYRVLHP